MSDTRRDFFNSTAVAMAGLSAAGPLTAQAASPAPQQGGRGQGGRGGPGAQQPLRPASEVQVPKMKFGNTEISRLVCGCNQFYGFSHFNSTLDAAMREYYTQARVCDVLHQCNRFGINGFNYYPGGRGQSDRAGPISAATLPGPRSVPG